MFMVIMKMTVMMTTKMKVKNTKQLDSTIHAFRKAIVNIFILLEIPTVKNYCSLNCLPQLLVISHDMISKHSSYKGYCLVLPHGAAFSKL
jgi:hypothetical protein